MRYWVALLALAICWGCAQGISRPASTVSGRPGSIRSNAAALDLSKSADDPREALDLDAAPLPSAPLPSTAPLPDIAPVKPKHELHDAIAAALVSISADPKPTGNRTREAEKTVTDGVKESSDGIVDVGRTREGKLVSHEEGIATPEPIYEQQDIRTGEELIDIDRFERPLAEVTVDIRPSAGELPEGLKIDEALANQHAQKFAAARHREIACAYTPWTICYRPLWFEEINLERYGCTYGILQPGVSFVHFFGTVGLLPYEMAVRRPRSCLCSNGFSQCGDCPLPGYYDPLFRLDAALIEAAVVSGIVIALP